MRERIGLDEMAPPKGDSELARPCLARLTSHPPEPEHACI
jgi:hypothetical protein